MEPGCSCTRTVHLPTLCLPTRIHSWLPLHSQPPSPEEASFCKASARGSRAQMQQDAGAAHLVWDSPHLTWSKSPLPPLVVSWERQAGTDLSRSRADVRRRSAVSHIGCAWFSFSMKGMWQLVPMRGVQPGSSAWPRCSCEQLGSLTSAYGWSNAHQISSHYHGPAVPSGAFPWGSWTGLPRESQTSMRPGVRAGKWPTRCGQCTLIPQQSATKGPVGPVEMRQSCLALVGFMGYLVLWQWLTAWH